MSRQTSKNRWVNGKRTLKWFFNPSEFAGGSECGTRIPLGEMLVTENGEKVESLPCFTAYERDSAIDLFLRCGVVNAPNEFDENDVFEIIRSALRQANDNRINDVEVDQRSTLIPPPLGGQQLVITTDNGDVKQRFVIEASSIIETECEQ
jgi:hypothetical protein